MSSANTYRLYRIAWAVFAVFVLTGSIFVYDAATATEDTPPSPRASIQNAFDCADDYSYIDHQAGIDTFGNKQWNTAFAIHQGNEYIVYAIRQIGDTNNMELVKYRTRAEDGLRLTKIDKEYLYLSKRRRTKCRIKRDEGVPLFRIKSIIRHPFDIKEKEREKRERYYRKKLEKPAKIIILAREGNTRFRTMEIILSNKGEKK